MVVCVTNMAYKTAPGLLPKHDQEINWIDFPLQGNEHSLPPPHLSPPSGGMVRVA